MIGILTLTRSPNPNRPRRPVVTVNETDLEHLYITGNKWISLKKCAVSGRV